jgi:hypothetical protein
MTRHGVLKAYRFRSNRDGPEQKIHAFLGMLAQGEAEIMHDGGRAEVRSKTLLVDG